MLSKEKHLLLDGRETHPTRRHPEHKRRNPEKSCDLLGRVAALLDELRIIRIDGKRLDLRAIHHDCRLMRTTRAAVRVLPRGLHFLTLLDRRRTRHLDHDRWKGPVTKEGRGELLQCKAEPERLFRLIDPRGATVSAGQQHLRHVQHVADAERFAAVVLIAAAVREHRDLRRIQDLQVDDPAGTVATLDDERVSVEEQAEHDLLPKRRLRQSERRARDPAVARTKRDTLPVAPGELVDRQRRDRVRDQPDRRVDGREP